MKHLFLAAMIVCSVATAQAQDKNMPKSMATAAKNDSWNIRFGPVGLLIGLINMKVDYLVTDHIAIGGDFLTWNFALGDNSIKVNGYGIGAHYYFNPRFEDTWYLTAGLSSGSFDATLSPLSGTKRTASYSGVLTTRFGGGYHWFWQSFNMNLGATLQSSSQAKIEYKDTSGTVVETVNAPGIGGGLEFLLGWTF